MIGPVTGLGLKYNECPICPHCGHEHGDAFEWQGDSGETECERCEKEFHYEREISVTYSTSLLAARAARELGEE